jgi:hypothetical protein
MRWLNKYISLIERSMLLMIFMIYSVGIMMFYHTHEVQDLLVTHSHPFKRAEGNSPVENHSHTTSQYFLFQHLCQTSMTESLFNFIDSPLPVYLLFCVIISSYSKSFYSNAVSTASSREPPLS